MPEDLKSRLRWVHLRLCLRCDHVSCCDSSPGRHTTKHFYHTSHPVVGPAKPVQRPEAPAPGEVGYERIVQGNWNVPAWMRAKVRAAAEESGVSQNDVVQEALRRHLEETERGRGGGFALEARHFGIRRGGR